MPVAIARATHASSSRHQPPRGSTIRDGTSDIEDEPVRRGSRIPATRTNGNGNGNGNDTGDGDGSADEAEESDEEMWTVESYRPRQPSKDQATTMLRGLQIKLEAPIKQIEDSLYVMGKIAAGIADAGEHEEEIDKIQRQLLDSLNIRKMLQIRMEVIKSLQDQLHKGAEIADLEGQLKVETRKKEAEWNKLSELAKFKAMSEFEQFRSAIWNATHENEAGPPMSKYLQRGEEDDDNESDSDIEMGTTTQDFRCPITKLTLERACRSKVCNHHYSRAAIESMFKSNSTPRCPMIGCSHKVRKSDLVDDDKLQRQADEYERRRKRREADSEAGEPVDDIGDDDDDDGDE